MNGITVVIRTGPDLDQLYRYRNEIIPWLEHNCRYGYRLMAETDTLIDNSHGTYCYEIEFDDENDAALFRLMWGHHF